MVTLDFEENSTSAAVVKNVSTENSSVDLSDYFTEDMLFGKAQIANIVMNSLMLVIGVLSNVSTLYSLLRERYVYKKKKRISTLLIHLAISDLMVILIHMPLEIGWSFTVRWYSNALMCKSVIFARSIGFYLSALIIMIISIDRLHAVIYPIQHRMSKTRTRKMIIAAWIISPICCIPQRLVYVVTTMTLTSFLPLLVMIACYATILVVLHKRNKLNFTSNCSNLNSPVATESMPHHPSQIPHHKYDIQIPSSYYKPQKLPAHCNSIKSGPHHSPNSHHGHINHLEGSGSIKHPQQLKGAAQLQQQFNQQQQRLSTAAEQAKLSTVKTTGILIVGFMVCWAPYQILSLWSQVDEDGANKIPYTLQKIMWSFSAANNCFNPIFYNLASISRCKNIFRNLSRSATPSTNIKNTSTESTPKQISLRNNRPVIQKISFEPSDPKENV